jgi:hypothetical protein
MMDQYIVVFVPGALNESGVGVYVVVDTGGEVISKPAVARCVDGPAAIVVATALNA